MYRAKHILLIGSVALAAVTAIAIAESPVTVVTRDWRSVDHASPSLANVVGEELPTAYARLHRGGFKVTFKRAFSIDWSGECVPIVIGATVLTGAAADAHPTVLLATKIPLCGAASPAVPVPRPTAVRVPKFIGKPLTAAIRWAAEHELSWAATIPPLAGGSAASLYGNYTIASQQPRPGARLAVGIARGSGWLPTPLQLGVRQTHA